jgi:class 3 adenylate cyclase
MQAGGVYRRPVAALLARPEPGGGRMPNTAASVDPTRPLGAARALAVPPEPDLRRTGALGLRFIDPEVERSYAGWHLRRAAFFVRLGAAGIAFSWFNACVTVALLRPDALWSFVAVLAVMQAPFVALMLFGASSEDRHHWLLPASVTALVLGTLLSVAVCTWVYEDQGTAIGALIICAYFVPLLRMPTGVAAVEGLLVGLGYLPFLAFGEAVHGLAPGVQLLYGSLWVTSTGVSLGLAYVIEVDERRAFVGEQTIIWQRAQVAAEKARAERLLLNVLPGPIAERLKGGDLVIADAVAEVTVLFLDIVGFTVFARERSPGEVVEVLNGLFTSFDDMAERNGVEKIKTIGDAYMAVAGLPTPRADHAQAAANLALDLRDWMTHTTLAGGRLQIRIGLYSGSVVAGVIGKSKFAYDLWGDAVNSAARMESHGVIGEVQIGAPTRELLGEDYVVEDRGEIEVKGKGPMRAYLLRGRR